MRERGLVMCRRGLVMSRWGLVGEGEGFSVRVGGI